MTVTRVEENYETPRGPYASYKTRNKAHVDDQVELHLCLVYLGWLRTGALELARPAAGHPMDC